MKKISRRTVLSALGLGGAGLLTGCIDDLSLIPLNISLASSSSSVSAAGSVMLTATIDSGSAQSVEFYEGATLLGTVNAAPYTYSLNYASSQNGTHTYISKVLDPTSKTAWSNPVVVSVNIATTPPPTPSLVLSASSTSFTAAGTLTLNAMVQNATLSKVEFYDDTTLVATVTAAPYSTSITFAANAPSLAHNYSAKGYTTTGTVSSNVVAVNVNIGQKAPTVGLSSSSNTVTTASSITLTATATATAGTISKVEFFEGATLLTTKTAAPYTHTISYAAAQNGTHSYSAKATDSNNNSASSTAVSVAVNIAQPQPTISLATSSNNVTTASAITLTATVTPVSGTTISKVEFFEGATLLGSKTAAPYTQSISFTASNNGSHNYTAKVTDSAGATATSSAVAVTVNIAATTGTKIANYSQLAATGAYVNFQNPKLGNQNSILYRSATAQTGGISYNGAYYVAYSRKCTHAGTIISNNPNASTHILTCQDHGATFNLEQNCSPGNPASNPLPSLLIEARADGIYLP